MALYIIGLGLNDQFDISLKGLEAVKKSDFIYLESYTSVLQCKKEDLENLYKKEIIIADREFVEKKAESIIIPQAKESNVAFLVIGDVFSATTHMQLFMEAKRAGVNIIVIHNASVVTAAGMTGLEVYKFGKTTSIPFHNKEVASPVETLWQNQKNGLHTLFLLDLDPINNRFLTIKEAIDYLVSHGVDSNSLGVGCAALGSEEPEISAAHLSKLRNHNFTKYPQCLIIPAKELHFVEEEMISLWK
jgi:diphthine synthase